MARMNVTEKDFESFFQATESLMDGPLKQGNSEMSEMTNFEETEDKE